MNFYVNCSSKRANTGLNSLCQDLGPISGYIVTPYDWEVEASAAYLKATYETAISADSDERIYPFPSVLAMTDNSEDAIFEELSLGNLFVRDGKINLMFVHESSRYKHEALKSHTLQSVGVLLIDQQGRIHGVEEDGKFQAIKLQQFVVGRLNLNDGSGVATKTSVTMIFEDTSKWELSPAVVSGLDWSPKDLEGLIDIDLAVVDGTASTSGVTITCAVAGSGDAFNPVGPDTADGDIVIKDSAGVAQTITSVTSSEGTAVVTATLAAGDYTIDFYPPDEMETTGYESTGAVEFTVSA